MNQLNILREFVPANHKHSACIADALMRAEDICQKEGSRLTPVRRRVLELVWNSHEPVKAYDLLAQLQKEKAKAAPPTIYRALDFLLGLGFVHKVESLNAYVGCGSPGHKGTGQLLICQQCSEVAELDDSEVTAQLGRLSQELGFEIASQIIEIKGKCGKCQGIKS